MHAVPAKSIPANASSTPNQPCDGYMLHEALAYAAILAEVELEMVFVDRGHKEAKVDHVQTWRPRRRHSVTGGLKPMIRRRSSIEPTIGHMKNAGKLGRGCLKGTLDDALNAIL